MDISLARAGSAIAGGVCNIPVGGVGIFGATAKNLPHAIGSSYKALKAETHIGPNLKALIGVVGIPGTAALTLPVALAGGAGYGLVSGFASGMNKDIGFFKSFAETWDGVQTFDDYARKGLNFLDQYMPDPLPDGERPFDIRILEGLKGLIAGVTVPVAMAPAVGALTLYRTPKIWWNLLSELWKENPESPIKNSTLTLGASLAALLAPPIALTGGALFGFGWGVFSGYNEGLKATWKNTGDMIEKYDDMLRQAGKF